LDLLGLCLQTSTCDQKYVKKLSHAGGLFKVHKQDVNERISVDRCIENEVKDVKKAGEFENYILMKVS
jgi:hypothetical protein